MQILELAEIALQGILANRLRSTLTVLGIVIGIASVITLLAVGQGAKEQAEKQIQSLGTNLIYVRPGSAGTGGVSLGGGSAPTLTIEDAYAIRDNCPAVADVAPVYNSNYQVQYGENNTLTSIVGTEPSHTEVRNFHAVRGRFFNQSDVDLSARVAVIGDTVAENLFQRQDPIGKEILIRGELFEVIGLMEHKGASQMNDMDDQIFVPISTGYSTLFGLNAVTGRSVRNILVQAKDGEDLQAQFQITNLLRQRHNIQSPDQDDFMLRTQADIMQTAQSITGVFSLLLGATAGISLLVGGIGIMNIMLVSVSERTREIGIRKAIGAKYTSILSQFVLESVILSLSGGIMGIILGYAGSYSISQLAKWSTTVTPLSVILSFAVSLAIGLFFGIYPARKAAKLDPIVSLRAD
jgi:putative ABC transport system permease protein